MNAPERADSYAWLPPPGAGPRSTCGEPPARCAGCGLHELVCLCPELPRLSVRTRVVLLMHRAESRKSTNTGRLVARILEGSEIRIRGEQAPSVRRPLPEGRKLLLYPHAEARILSPDDALTQPLVLLVPDGNWNQARRMSRRDEDAREAEPVALPPGPPSRVGLRRNPREATLCTLEAVARAMGVLEGAAIERCMMNALDTFIERSLRAAGRPARPPR
mgnify:CR=1 FL=1